MFWSSTAEFGDAPTEQVNQGVRIVRLPAWPMPQIGSSVDFDLRFAFGPRNLRRVFRLLDEFGPDVIHQHGQFFDLTWLTSIYSRRRNIPTLLSIHTRLESTRRFYDLVFRCLDAVVVRSFIALSAPHVVIMDELMDRYVEQRYHIPDDRRVPIPVGVYVDRFEQEGDAQRVREKHGLTQGQPIVVSLGHVIPLRDRMLLVEALPRLLARVPDLRVLVVGKVYYKQFLVRARELGVDHRIILAGAIPREEVIDYLSVADVETHDLQGLGFGTANLESMMARVPVVAAVAPTIFPGIPLRSGENITLVPTGNALALADAIADLIDDPVRARLIADAQFELVTHHFEMHIIAKQHLEEMASLTDAPARRSSSSRSKLMQGAPRRR